MEKTKKYSTYTITISPWGQSFLSTRHGQTISQTLEQFIREFHKDNSIKVEVFEHATEVRLI
jgi:hypothetical protein